VPPRDGDRSSTDTDGELLARVIPLRRRESEPDEPLQSQPFEPELVDTFDVAPEPSSPLERSVWDQPITELRRRETQSPARASLVSRLATRARPRVYGAHPPRWSIAAAVGIIGLAIVALALGALHGQPGASARGAVSATVSATADAKLAGTSSTAGETQRGSSSSQPSSAHHRQKARGRAHRSEVSGGTRQRQPDTHATHTARGYVPAGSGADTSATVQDGSTATPVRSVPVAEHAVESAPASSRSPSPSHASARSPLQSSCVPGELGC
jgi:hypothetical protein